MATCSKCGNLMTGDGDLCQKCKERNNNNNNLSDLLLVGDDHTVTDLLLINSVYNNLGQTVALNNHNFSSPVETNHILPVIDQQPGLTGPIEFDDNVPTGNGECCDCFEDGCDCDCCDGCDCDCGGCDCDCGGCDCDCGGCDECVIL